MKLSIFETTRLPENITNDYMRSFQPLVAFNDTTKTYKILAKYTGAKISIKQNMKKIIAAHKLGKIKITL